MKLPTPKQNPQPSETLRALQEKDRAAMQAAVDRVNAKAAEAKRLGIPLHKLIPVS